MYELIVDSHIHLDQYTEIERKRIIDELDEYNVKALIVVSTHLQSANKILKLASNNKRIKPALGFHPEQEILNMDDINTLMNLIQNNTDKICAIGEVGLPYYLQKDKILESNERHIEVLTEFIKLANQLHKPLALHAVYGDAILVCDLLEKYSIEKAHFHWFKGDERTVQRMISNRYYISITPDVLYEKEIMELVSMYPLDLMMVETDGPWPFLGPFENKLTHPKMIHHIIEKIGEIKGKSYREVANIIYHSTSQFYNLKY